MNLNRTTFIAFFLGGASLLLSSCKQDIPAIKEKIIENKITAMRQLSQAAMQANWMDDTEALWGYEQADSILHLALCHDDKTSMARVHQATSFLFYGSSYVNTIIGISMGYTMHEEEPLTLEPLRNLLIREIPDSLDSRELLLLEAKANAAIAFSAYVSELVSSDFLQHTNDLIEVTEEMFEKFPAHNAECAITFINAQTFFNAIVPIYRSYNQARTDATTAPQEILDIAEEFDAFPLEDALAGEISPEEMLDYRLIISEAQRLLVEKLTEEISLI